MTRTTLPRTIDNPTPDVLADELAPRMLVALNPTPDAVADDTTYMIVRDLVTNDADCDDQPQPASSRETLDSVGPYLAPMHGDLVTPVAEIAQATIIWDDVTRLNDRQFERLLNYALPDVDRISLTHARERAASHARTELQEDLQAVGEAMSHD